MKNVMIMCAALALSALVAPTAFAATGTRIPAQVTQAAQANENPPVTNVISADTTEFATTAAVCPCGVAGTASSLVAANKGQTNNAVHPTGPATPAAGTTGTSRNAEPARGH